MQIVSLVEDNLQEVSRHISWEKRKKKKKKNTINLSSVECWICQVRVEFLTHQIIANKLPGITKTRLFKYIENFISKNWTFSD